MKFFIGLLLTALMGFVAGLYLPWWIVAVTSFLVSLLITQSPGRSLLSGFLGIFLLWLILACWIDSQNSSILSQKIARVLPLGGSVFLLIILTAFIPALVSGLASLTGAYAQKFKIRTD